MRDVVTRATVTVPPAPQQHAAHDLVVDINPDTTSFLSTKETPVLLFELGLEVVSQPTENDAPVP